MDHSEKPLDSVEATYYQSLLERMGGYSLGPIAMQELRVMARDLAALERGR